ncbi:hypothetical protein [Actinomadura decatromicini]|uniref:Uncharacterized protein n=1 Tax=Actinomadura decatromicini TaxID=2604572 RepID=A0A5D3FFH6_9ACTN|nr:hypothetical protein [Actinomadura decatromicini]TYK46983.1 hypothetical protein FXF68_24505 [Actinomadura decatromicini]
MSNRLFYPAGNKEFAADLRRLRSDCGEPNYSSLIGIVPKLDEFFPLKHGRTSLPESVSRSHLSQFFNGARQPSAEYLAVIVLSHLRCAAENGSIRIDPATDAPLGWEAILEAWQKRLREARQQDDVRDASPAPNPSAPADRSSVLPSVSLIDPGTPRRADPVHLAPGEVDALIAHGAYGNVLHEHAALGDREAIYQVGVVLALHRDYRVRAVAYLLNATAAGHPTASGLVPDSGQGIDLCHALARAKTLADMAETSGHETALRFFRLCVLRADLGDRPVAVEGDEPH